MDSAIKPWVELWDYLDRNFWSMWQWSAEHLRREEVGWQPITQVASLGWNLLPQPVRQGDRHRSDGELRFYVSCSGEAPTRSKSRSLQ